MAKVSLRLLPFLFLLYVVNILDRANIGFARLQMLDALHMRGRNTPSGPAFSTSAISSSRCRAT